MSYFDITNLPGVHLAPNIQETPDIYEIENMAADPDRLIEATMLKIAPWTGKIVLDLGAGTGFHLPRFHPDAQHVFAVEPHDASRLRAMERVAKLGLERTSVMIGSAAQVLLPDKSIDIVHSRFAYFWGPGCEPGLLELKRIVRPGGTVFIIDNDWQYGTFATWLRRSSSKEHQADQVERFWESQGFTLIRIASEWRFQNRTDLETVIRVEFPNDLASQILVEHSGISVEYGYCLYYRQY